MPQPPFTHPAAATPQPPCLSIFSIAAANASILHRTYEHLRYHHSHPHQQPPKEKRSRHSRRNSRDAPANALQRASFITDLHRIHASTRNRCSSCCATITTISRSIYTAAPSSPSRNQGSNCNAPGPAITTHLNRIGAPS